MNVPKIRQNIRRFLEKLIFFLYPFILFQISGFSRKNYYKDSCLLNHINTFAGNISNRVSENQINH